MLATEVELKQFLSFFLCFDVDYGRMYFKKQKHIVSLCLLDIVSLCLLACRVLSPASSASFRKLVFEPYHEKRAFYDLSCWQSLMVSSYTVNEGLPFLLPAFALLNSSDSSDPLTLGTCFEQGSHKDLSVQPVHCCIKLLSVFWKTAQRTTSFCYPEPELDHDSLFDSCFKRSSSVLSASFSLSTLSSCLAWWCQTCARLAISLLHVCK